MNEIYHAKKCENMTVAKEEMTAIYLFKKFDFCKGIPLGKSNFLKW